MKQPTALVTGASSGIGARVAELLSRQGFGVIGAARRVEAIEALGGVTPLPLDLADPNSVSTAAKTVLAQSGSLEVLINCAGYGEFGTIEEAAIDDARREFEVNVFGAMQLTQAILPAMRAAGRGRIVNVSSLAGEFAAPLGGWYHAAKFALEALSDSLRGEVAQFGIQVTVVQPSYVATDWHERALERLQHSSGAGAYAGMVDALRRHLTSAAVARQFSTVDEVAQVIVEAATTAHPRTRYRVGRGARLAVALATVLPDRVFDRFTRQQFGYPPPAMPAAAPAGRDPDRPGPRPGRG